jgi:imidazole glycerol-phosphate synthase subunit HisF
MLRTRVIPCLQLRGESLVKTVRFNSFTYVGDPTNTCRIFNDLEVDELAFLDISASAEGREPNYELLRDISNECFMPVSYGGGVSSQSIAQKVLQLGFEKIIINTAALENPFLIDEVSKTVGSQSVIVSIDVKRGIFGPETCRGMSARSNSRRNPVEWAREVESRGAGEILLTNVDKEGTWEGADLSLTRSVADAVGIPIIAHGGVGSLLDIRNAVKEGGASAVGVGSLVVFQKKGMGVLVNFPDEDQLSEVLK